MKFKKLVSGIGSTLLLCSLVVGTNASVFAEELPANGLISIATLTDTNKPLAETTISIYASGNTGTYQSNELVARGTTDEKGKLISPSLVAGSYIVKEEATPETHAIDSTSHYVMVQDGNTTALTYSHGVATEKKASVSTRVITGPTVVEEQQNAVLMTVNKDKKEFLENEQKNTVTTTTREATTISENEKKDVSIVVADADSGSTLTGVSLKLVDASNTSVATFKSEEAPSIVKDLVVNANYSLIVEELPSGYVAGDNVAFTVTGKEVPQSVVVNVSPTVCTFKACDASDNAVIEDINFAICDKDGKEVSSFKTAKEDARITALAAGEYVIKQMSSAKGYAKMADMDFKVEDVASTQTTVLANERIKGNAKISLKDSDGKIIKDGKFSFYKTDEKENVIETLVIDEKGEAITSNIIVGTYADGAYQAPIGYSVKQVEALSGYTKDDKEHNIVFEDAQLTSGEKEVTMNIEVTNVSETASNDNDKNGVSGNTKTGDMTMNDMLTYGVCVILLICAVMSVVIKKRNKRNKKK